MTYPKLAQLHIHHWNNIGSGKIEVSTNSTNVYWKTWESFGLPVSVDHRWSTVIDIPLWQRRYFKYTSLIDRAIKKSSYCLCNRAWSAHTMISVLQGNLVKVVCTTQSQGSNIGSERWTMFIKIFVVPCTNGVSVQTIVVPVGQLIGISVASRE